AFYERTRLIGQLQLFTKPRFGGFFLLSALEIASKCHLMHRSHGINYHICDIKHISLLPPLLCLFSIC
ncbi:hypothetical protein, partial [Enterobacter ludwigii]|uniref:hypothetical protein n=1 Tax=Enterobacter ludwigii TaxID=299767 RepID=UPI0019537A0B